MSETVLCSSVQINAKISCDRSQMLVRRIRLDEVALGRYEEIIARDIGNELLKK